MTNTIEILKWEQAKGLRNVGSVFPIDVHFFLLDQTTIPGKPMSSSFQSLMTFNRIMNQKYDSADDAVFIQVGKNSLRKMNDTSRTFDYVRKLSYAAIVRVTFRNGSWLEYECGEIINRSK